MDSPARSCPRLLLWMTWACVTPGPHWAQAEIAPKAQCLHVVSIDQSRAFEGRQGWLTKPSLLVVIPTPLGGPPPQAMTRYG